MKNNFAKWKPYIFLAILLLSLIPLIWLGRYNYPTGDDYYYGAETHLVWQQTGSIIQTLDAACAGVADSYQIWQGTYSALFLMYLAPNVFSNTAYHLVTFVILLLLCGGIFYLLCPLFRRFLPGTCGEWITVSSILSFLCIQTVEFQCDSFYWYNGSMYYTGFFAVTLFFLGTLFRYLDNGKRILLLPLLLFAVFLGGGNYVSLLPCMLLSVTITLLLLLQKNKKSIYLRDYFCRSPVVLRRKRHSSRQSRTSKRHVEDSCLESDCKMSVTGHPLYLCLDGIVVGACRAASAAGLPADPAEEKRSIFLPPYSVYRLCLRTVLLHVLSPVLYHELHGTGPGGCHRLLYVPTDQFYRILLLDRLCGSENAGTTDPPGENRSLRKA